MTNRIDSLRNKFNLTCSQCLIISSKVNRLYFSSFPSSDGIMLITYDNTYLLVDFRYFEAAKKTVSCADILLYDDFNKDLKQLLLTNKIKTLFLENQNISLSTANRFSELAQQININTIKDNTLDEAIYSLRMVKTYDEIKKIKASQAITDFAFSEILQKIHIGMSERDIALEIEFLMRKNSAQSVSFDLITIFGENTSLPHGVPTHRKLKNGDLVTLDIGAVFDGYCSDMTRTFAVGKYTEEQKTIYNIVLQAQKKALDLITPKTMCSQIDKAARNYIYNAGFKGCFGHSTGHSLGLEIHEKPTFSSKDDTILLPGMIMTVEPGIYLENKFGVRIEDMILVTADGYENLTYSPKNFTVI